MCIFHISVVYNTVMEYMHIVTTIHFTVLYYIYILLYLLYGMTVQESV